MTDNEMILALRTELQPVRDELKNTQLILHDFMLHVENVIEPKINLLAENYT